MGILLLLTFILGVLINQFLQGPILFSEDFLNKVSAILGWNLQKKITHLTEEINNRLKMFIDKKAAEDPDSADKVVSIEVCKGYPADEILKKADALNCDAIVMGTHGKGIVSLAFFGSVAKRVLRRVRKPVFIIPLPEE